VSDPSPRKREKASELPRLEEVATPPAPAPEPPGERQEPARRRSRRRPAQTRDSAPAAPSEEKREAAPTADDGEKTRRGGATPRRR
jgi:hypothetical protein